MDAQVWSAGDPAFAPANADLDEARRQIMAALLADAGQESLRSDLLAFTEDHPDCLYRSCSLGHLTGSGVVVDPLSGRSLLIHHAKLERWLQPGGHADGDGNLGAVAWREATEETGLSDLALVTPAIDVDIHSIAARGGEPEHLHLDLRFVILVGSDRQPAPNHETLGARWMAPDAPEIVGSVELHRVVSRAIDVAASRFGQ